MQRGETVAPKTSCRNALPTLTGVLQTVLRLLPRLAQHLQGALPIRRMHHHPRLLRNLSLRVAASIPIAMQSGTVMKMVSATVARTPILSFAMPWEAIAARTSFFCSAHEILSDARPLQTRAA